MRLPVHHAPPARDPSGPWGSRARIGATLRDLEDLLGNRDGLWGNETSAPGQLAAGASSRPALAAMRAAAATGLHTRDEQDRLRQALDECEQAWGAPVSELDPSRLPGGRLFGVQKALMLVRWGRHPREVTDTFVEATGGVAGVELVPRSVFVRSFAPTAPSSGTTVVVVPGHALGGRGAAAQIAALNARGHRVLAMEHQWSAHATGSSGGLDRGFGLVRDLAAVLGAAHLHLRPRRLAILAHSAGAGMAALGLVLLQAAGALTVPGTPLPAALPLVLECPWLGAGWCFADPEPEPGRTGPRRPDIAALAPDHPVVAARATQLAVLEDTRVPRQLPRRLEGDLEQVLTLVADGLRPAGPVAIVHGEADPFADPQLARHLASALDARLTLLPTSNHLLCLDPGHHTAAVQALADLLGDSDPVQPLTPPAFGAARDRTLRFSVLAARAATGQHILPESAGNHAYLTVPGLFTERYPGYMRAKFGRMAALGLDHGLVPVDTDAGVRTNATVVRQAVLERSARGRSVVLLGHSKGGVDIAAALALFPELRAHVHAVITLQAPWLGTPIGDLVADRSVLQWAARFIVESAWKGEAAALTDLGLRARADFVARHPWPEQIPTVCLATSLRSWSTLLRVPDAMLARRHGPTDGLVPMAHAVLPGADAVFLRDVDHGGPVLPRPLGTCAHLDPGDVTAALIALALERAADDQASGSAPHGAPPRS